MVEQNPRTEHAARIAPPESFRSDSFRRKRIAPGVVLVLGKRPRSRTTETQSIRFAADTFTPAEARDWLERQGYRPTAFEAANPREGGATSPELDGVYDQLKLHAAHVAELGNFVLGASHAFVEHPVDALQFALRARDGLLSEVTRLRDLARTIDQFTEQLAPRNPGVARRAAPLERVQSAGRDLVRVAAFLSNDVYPETRGDAGEQVLAAIALVEAASATARASASDDPAELLEVGRGKIGTAIGHVRALGFRRNEPAENPPPAESTAPAPPASPPSPAAENPRELVQIGIARQLDLEDGTRYKWNVSDGWPVLVEAGAESAEPGRARVYLVSPSTRSAPGPAGDAGDKAAATFKTWHGFDARKVYQLDVPAASEFRTVNPARAVSIVYRSDKWEGRPVDYVHDFERNDPPAVLCCGDADAPRAMMLRGGQLRVTRRGLVH